MKIVTLLHDSDLENPSDFEGAWTLYSFGRRHVNHRDPEDFFPNGKPSLAIRRKLAVGTAFVLSYYEHSGCAWSLRGQGTQCRFDSVDVAGILVWEHNPKDMGAGTLEARAADAEGFLKTYNAWANGDGYGYQVEEVITQPCGHTEVKDVDSCFGFYGLDLEYMAERVRAAVGGDTVEIRGEAKDMADVYDFGRAR